MNEPTYRNCKELSGCPWNTEMGKCSVHLKYELFCRMNRDLPYDTTVEALVIVFVKGLFPVDPLLKYLPYMV